MWSGDGIRATGGKKSTEDEPGVFLLSFKPEGEGENNASEGSSQPYKPPVHGKESATTTF